MHFKPFGLSLDMTYEVPRFFFFFFFKDYSLLIVRKLFHNTLIILLLVLHYHMPAMFGCYFAWIRNDGRTYLLSALLFMWTISKNLSWVSIFLVFCKEVISSFSLKDIGTMIKWDFPSHYVSSWCFILHKSKIYCHESSFSSLLV